MTGPANRVDVATTRIEPRDCDNDATGPREPAEPAEPDIGPVPDISGHFRVEGAGAGAEIAYGGRFAPESLMAALDELSVQYEKARHDAGFQAELTDLLVNYAGRPSLLYHAKNFSEIAGTTVLLKREDLNHTGSHKINNVLGQALLAKKMGKQRLIAETGAGQHGVATATAAALLGMECAVYMGEEDTERQALNVARMRILGATVHPVAQGTRTLKDAMNEAFRDWVGTVENTHYCIGSVGGPHPFPMMVRDFQRIIGVEAREQVLKDHNKLPDAVVACVGGGSNAIGLFHAFIPDAGTQLIGCEAGGDGIDTPRHAATLTAGSPGVLHGMRTFLLQDAEGQTLPTHSISAGLDYPGVGPEHVWLLETGRASYRSITDAQAMDAFGTLCRTEGIIPAIESAHALAGALQIGPALGKDGLMLVSLSGRGDKDMDTASKWFAV